MRTKVNGFEIEGTPEEVYAFIKIIDDARRDGVHIKPPRGKPPEWAYDLDKMNTAGSVQASPKIISGGLVSCGNSVCYCTGECKL